MTLFTGKTKHESIGIPHYTEKMCVHNNNKCCRSKLNQSGWTGCLGGILGDDFIDLMKYNNHQFIPRLTLFANCC